MGETKNIQRNDFLAGVNFSFALMISFILCQKQKFWAQMNVFCFKNLNKYINSDNIMNCSFQNKYTMLKLCMYFK